MSSPMNKPPENLGRTVMTDPVHFLAFGFGTGLAPFAPGTFGSLPGILLFWLTMDYGLYVQLGVALAITLTGTDPESDPLTFVVVSGPSSGILSGVAPNLTYTPKL